MTQPLCIHWFRQDLRLQDNPALLAAARGGQLLPIYILDDNSPGDWAMGAASRLWLHHSLQLLNQSLQGKLRLFRGDSQSIIESLVEEHSVDAVHWNRCYEPWRRQRDSAIKSMLKERAIEVESHNGSLLWEPWEVLKKDDTPYKVYTPYYRNGCLAIAPPRQAQAGPVSLDLFPDSLPGSLTLDQQGLFENLPWQQDLSRHCDAGETAAHGKLDEFCESALESYRRGRDFPASQSTSMLSPHLHFGEISPQQVWHRIEQEQMRLHGDDPAHFKSELAWREFSYYQIYHFPDLPDKPLKAQYAKFAWREDAANLALWQRGQTGFPIIDAGMRELWQTGNMHNRVRMIVASFLVKNQLIHWREGARWFWDCLFDADLASNSAGWQWCAGSGVDASPWFRIFNPVLQSEKFDPDGDYLRQYCPELGALPNRYLHKPWLAPADVLQEAGIEMGVDYPLPILDLKTTRLRALEANKRLKAKPTSQSN